MGFLRITQSLLDFACECNKIKKQLTNLKNMNLTRQDTIEYLERMISDLLVDQKYVYDLVQSHVGRNDYMDTLNYETRLVADDLIYRMRQLINQLQKLDAN